MTDTAKQTGICPLCGEPYPPGRGGRLKHYAEKHPELSKAQSAKARAKQIQARKPSDEKPEQTKKPPRARQTVDYRQANLWHYQPKQFIFSSALLGLAKKVSMEAWGWPDYDMADGTFLDTYIFHTLKAAGISVAQWQYIKPEDEEEADGNGNKDMTDLKASVEQMSNTMGQFISRFDNFMTLLMRSAQQGGK